MVSSGCSTLYYDRMDTDPDDAPAIGENDNERLNMSYKTEQEKALRNSKATI